MTNAHRKNLPSAIAGEACGSKEKGPRLVCRVRGPPASLSNWNVFFEAARPSRSSALAAASSTGAARILTAAGSGVAARMLAAAAAGLLRVATAFSLALLIVHVIGTAALLGVLPALL